MGHGNLQIKLSGVLIALVLHFVFLTNNDRATAGITAGVFNSINCDGDLAVFNIGFDQYYL
jgi:hypothetical protein